MSSREAVEELIERKPGSEDHLREMLRVDREKEGWSFDDLSMDTGLFGWVVSAGIVEDTGEGYRVVDREAVEGALRGSRSTWRDPSRAGVAALLGAFALVVLFRVHTLPFVFRGEDVVLLGNDPYHYRYMVEATASTAGDLFDFGAVADPNGEPLMIASLWWASGLLGGGEGATGSVMAWYPLVSALLTGALVYVAATEVTGDRVAGVASVAVLAATPGHAFRTFLGFADHHAFDYPWLGVTLLALVLVSRGTRGVRSREGLTASGLLALGVTGQVLAWDNGPLLVAPVLLYTLMFALVSLRRGRSPLKETRPVIAGLGVAAFAAAGIHFASGWHTDQVGLSPALLLAGCAGVVVLAEASHRYGLEARSAAAAEAGLLVAGFAVFRLLLPAYAARLDSGLGVLFRESEIFEMQPLLAGGAVFDSLAFLGLAFFAAVPYAAWKSWETYTGGGRERWLPVLVYFWFFLGLSLVQRRFTGELAVPLAVIAGFGLVHLSAFVASRAAELAGPAGGERWERSLRLASLALLVVAVSGAGALPTSAMGEDLVVHPKAHDAARFMEDYSGERGWGYPENYVFSQWGRNRMYNYFVNGQSSSYGYAKSHYGNFIESREPDAWYERLRGRAGFVVTSPENINIEGDVPPDNAFSTLHLRLGSAGDDAPGLAHYRAIYADGRYVRVFTPVPGATVRGSAPPRSTMKLSTRVSIEGGTFVYERRVRVGPEGNYSVTVPYPGRYTVGGRRVTVPEDAVLGGRAVNVPP